MKGIQVCLLIVCVWGFSEVLASKYKHNRLNINRIRAQIVNGEKTRRGEFPHMALLLGPSTLRCGGSLISRRHMLTAAHCVVGKSPSGLRVRLGAYAHANNNENGSAVYRVKRITVHPDADAWANDVAVLTLAQAVNFTSLIQPIRIAKPSDGQFVGRTAVITGWGNTVGGGRSSPTLLKLNTSIVENEFCTTMFKNQTRRYPNVTETNVCTYRRNQSACHGDSGSPLFAYDCESREPIQIGVVNGGHVRCQLGLPNVFSRVSEFYDWIVDQMADSTTTPATATTSDDDDDEDFTE